jgi:hypothetical protein
MKIMNNKNCMLMAMCLTISILLFTACGDDDEDGRDNNRVHGQVTAIEDEETTNFVALDAEWTSGHIGYVDEVGCHYFSSGAVFSVTLRDKVQKKTMHFQFSISNNAREGSEAYAGSIFYYSYPYDMYNSIYCADNYDGGVYVKAIEGGKITLLFDDFRFKRREHYGVGGETYPKVTLNGVITFVNEQEESKQEESVPEMNVTLDGVNYSVGKSVYFHEWLVNDVWAFMSSLHSSDENKAFAFYYDYDDLERGALLDNSEMKIEFVNGGGTGSSVSSLNTKVLGGSVRVVEYSQGVGLRFNNLKFRTDPNSQHTYQLNGTIYYDFRYQ